MARRRPLAMRSRFRRGGRIAHALNWRWYAAQNSLQGLLYAARVLHKPWIDQDIRRTRDGILVCCHWVAQGKWFLHGHEVDTPIEHMNWAVVSQLVSADGYKITELYSHITFIRRRGLRIALKLEPKNPWTFTTDAQVQQVVRWARENRVKVSAYILRSNNVRVGHETQAALLTRNGIPCTVLR